MGGRRPSLREPRFFFGRVKGKFPLSKGLLKEDGG
jgi:hypothetical protein